LLHTICDATTKDSLAQVWIEGLQIQFPQLTKLKYIDGLIKYGDNKRTYVPDVDDLGSQVLFDFHDSPLGGHQGATGTFEKLGGEYH
jgi:hypothetical protein